MAHHAHLRKRWRAAAFALLPVAHAAHAQSSAPGPEPSTALPAVTVSGRNAPATASIGGFGDVPLARTPMQASVFGAQQLQDTNVQRLSDITRLAPGVSDAYNAEGYIDYLTVRGFVLDNRFNYRRDGLPINAESIVPLDNKAAIEVLEGTSGMQAGTSAPGGLVNFVVKRPLEMPLRRALIEWHQPGSVLGAVDISQRFGEGGTVGARLNVAAEHLDPWLRDARGSRNLFALALDARPSADTLLEAEVERSHRSQPSQPGFSVLGTMVPAPADPRINLNDQPWSQPVVFDGTTASLRWQQRLNADWRTTVHAMTQRLKTDDRLAFPFGCTAEGNFDRYCSNGTFDLYDYRSENERRRTDALDAHVDGHFATGGIQHALTTGVLGWRTRLGFQNFADNFVGTGSIDGNTFVPPSPDPVFTNTNRDEHSTELYARDAVSITPNDTLWVGLRHTQFHRQSVQTDGTGATDTTQTFNIPWLALSHAFGATGPIAYASWGQGVESEVTSNLPMFTNAGQALPSLKSRQTEVGVKMDVGHAAWSVAAFDIVKPMFADIGTCDQAVNDSCTHALDGTQRHRGVEASGRIVAGAWTLDGGAMWLHARREGSHDPTLDGKRPTNVPTYTAKAGAEWRLDGAVQGLALRAGVVREGPREALPDNSLGIPGWTRVDLGARLVRRVGVRTWTLRAGVDNAFNRRAWRESPFQFSHSYLYPMAPRTAWLSLQVDL